MEVELFPFRAYTISSRKSCILLYWNRSLYWRLTAPLAGSFLNQYVSFPYEIIGTLEKPLHALNLTDTVDNLSTHEIQPFVVAIDACLGSQQRIGEIIVHEDLYCLAKL